MTTDVHTTLLEKILPQLASRPAVTGIMLQGSVARHDHSPGSDLDLLILLENGNNGPFTAEFIDGIHVECHYGDLPNLKRKLTGQPGLVYGVVDGRILHDPTAGLAELQRFARNLLNTHAASEHENRNLQHWLDSTRSKLHAASATGDNFKAGFLASTNSWKILEGIWAINNQPMPPSGTVISQLPTLQHKPNDLDDLLTDMFTGTTTERVKASGQLIDWILQNLKEASAQ